MKNTMRIETNREQMRLDKNAKEQIQKWYEQMRIRMDKNR